MKKKYFLPKRGYNLVTGWAETRHSELNTINRKADKPSFAGSTTPKHVPSRIMNEQLVIDMF